MEAAARGAIMRAAAAFTDLGGERDASNSKGEHAILEAAGILESDFAATEQRAALALQVATHVCLDDRRAALAPRSSPPRDDPFP